MTDTSDSKTNSSGSRQGQTRGEPSGQSLGPAESPAYVVGIGASAGGLEAIEQFFDKMPSRTDMAFVVVQHLSPDFKSLMDELLSRHTEMPIYRVENEMVVEPNSIYLIPPRKEMVVSDGRLLLTDKDPSQALSLPIDVFFRSLAQDQRSKAVGVILSGTGSDGSRGVRDIHEAGGLILVQDEESAKFDGMPSASISTGVADFVMPPESMPEALLKYIQHPLAGGDTAERQWESRRDQGHYRAIFALLQKECGIDFNYYKPTTVGRRIERRMSARHISNLEEYVRCLREDPSELGALYKDLLIGVTQFFRDPEAFEVCEKEVIPKLVSTAEEENRDVRVWVPGCATGEEVYSLAILFDEYIRSSGARTVVKIFATDVHRESLNFAAAGQYPEAALENMPIARLERYFNRENGGYQIDPELRRLAVFAEQNVIKDPPFTKMDLISCRNLLIYLQPIAQKKVISLFHFSLRAGGMLMLGPSETLGEIQDEFSTIDSHWKIYSKRRDIRLPTEMRFPMVSGMDGGRVASAVPRSSVPTDLRLSRAYDALLERHLPPSLLINENKELVHTFGEARRFLKPPAGRAKLDVLSMVEGDLRVALAAAIQRAEKSGETVTYNGIRLAQADAEEYLRVVVDPVPDPKADATFMLISLQPIAAPHLAAEEAEASEQYDYNAENRNRIEELERELQYAREHLQATVEELETSNEELQASNEELLASNEELQSTNEELHSVNEELYTVNGEYEKKISELTELTNDMDNLLRSTEIGTIFLDRNLRIRKFTPAAAEAFNLLPQDVGRPLEHISYNIEAEDLLEDVREVIKTGRSLEREAHNRQGQWTLMRILPYRNQSHEIDGGVLTFIDITQLKSAQRDLKQSAEDLQGQSALMESIIQNMGEGVIVCDAEGKFLLFNPAAEELLGIGAEDVPPEKWQQTYGIFLEDGTTPCTLENSPLMRAVGGETVDDEICFIRNPKLDRGRHISVNARPLDTPGRGAVAVLRDVSNSRDIAEQRSRMAAIVACSSEAILSKDLQGNVLTWNAAAERIFGYPAEEIVGRSIGLLTPEGRENEEREILDTVRSGESVERLRTCRLRKDGSTVEVLLTVSPIRDESGEVVAASSIALELLEED